jgi:uncharacterized phage-associated protein
MVVAFEFDPQRTLAAIAYIASKELPRFDKYRVCKLVFLADRQHLVRYGRPITGDTYYALDWGPVPSATLDALNNNHPLSEELRKVLKKERAQTGKKRPSNPHYQLRSTKKLKRLWLEYLSKSDLIVLDDIVARYGDKTFSELYEITHALPAYYRAWGRREGNRSLMRFEEFFENDESADQEILHQLLQRVALIGDLTSADPEFSSVPISTLHRNPSGDGEESGWPFRRRSADA